MVVYGRGAPLRPDRIFAWNCWWFVGSLLFAWSRRHNNFEPVRFDQHRTYLLALEPSDIGLFAWARGHALGGMGASSVRGRRFTIASPESRSSHRAERAPLNCLSLLECRAWPGRFGHSNRRI